MILRKVEVVPYNSQWPLLFQIEAEKLAAIMGGEVVALHHVGSTAVPHLAAKPIIDILAEVKSIVRIDAFNKALRQAGYVPQGEFGVAGRRFFIKGDEVNRSHHVHMFQTGHPDIASLLTFRDYLVAHPDEAEAYSRLKETLAQQFPTDIQGYIAGKHSLVEALTHKAKLWQERK
jgi:GrpB-like predicted nucleotidyltransferase (UPF0157 family)